MSRRETRHVAARAYNLARAAGRSARVIAREASTRAARARTCEARAVLRALAERARVEA